MERRIHNFNYLKEALKGTEDKLILPEACANSKPSWFGFLITCKEGVDRNKLVQEIESRGVQTRMLFAGNLTKHPCFDQMRASGKGYRMWKSGKYGPYYERYLLDRCISGNDR